MRYVTLRVTPTEGDAFHPVGETLASEPAIERGTIRRTDILEDGTVLVAGEMRGDIDRYRELMDEHEDVYDCSVAEGEGWWYTHLLFEPNETVEELVGGRYETELTIEMPIEVASDGSMVYTLVGPETAFDGVPTGDEGGYETEVLETGTHDPQFDDFFCSLTPRQREVLDAAVSEGYYRNPREATHADVASAVGVSPSTVGEHLRKIESRVFERLASS